MKNNYLRTLYGCLKYKLFKIPTPLRIKHYITYRCNLNCPYCYTKGFEADELSTQEIKCLIDSYRDRGAVQWTFIGGEPLIRDDIGELITYTKQKGFIVGMVTNGVLIEEKIKDLKDLDKVLISPKSLNDASKELIKKLKRENINVGLNIVVSKGNYREFDFIMDFGIKNKVYVNLCPVEPVNENSKNDCLNIRQLNEIAEKIEKVKNNKYIMSSSYNFRRRILYLEGKIKRFQEVKCLAGKMYLALLPNGKVSPCWLRLGKSTQKVDCDCTCPGFNDLNKFFSFKIIGNPIINKWNMGF